jgi:galactose mutarotase-like enzyme
MDMTRRNESEQVVGCQLVDSELSGELKILVLENEKIKIKVLADRGADLISFIVKDKNLDIAWRTSTDLPTKKVASDHPADIETFMNGYPGGWQTIFPNGGLPSTYNGVAYGQHDEVAVLPWDYQILTENLEEVSILFKILTPKSPFEVTKTYTLKKGESICHVKEQVRNLSDDNWPVMWGFHFTFGEPFLDENSYIVIAGTPVAIPYEDKEIKARRVGSTEEFPWPIGKDENGNEIDFSKLPKRRTNSDILYLNGLTTGQYEVISPTFNTSVKITWDKKIFPYLWFWQEFGASMDAPWFGKHYNIGLEPFSSYPSSGIAEAVENGSALLFKGGDLIENNYVIEVTATD